MIKTLIPLVVGFITGHSDLEPIRDLPSVTFADNCTISREVGRDCGSDVAAWYDFDTNVMMLPLDFDVSDPWDMSILVHELTHWMQDTHGTTPCTTAALEIQAYTIQQAYLSWWGVNGTKEQIMKYNIWCYSSRLKTR